MHNLYQISKKFRIILLLISSMQSLLTSGIIFGWPNISLILASRNQYKSLCSENASIEDDLCFEQKKRLDLIFATCIGVIGISSYVWGEFHDRFGPRKTCILGSSLLLSGSLLLIWANSKTFDSYFPGFYLISSGGVAINFGYVSIANLFFGWESTILTIFSALYGASAFIFLLFRNLYEKGISWKAIFIGYSVFLTIQLLTAFLFPNKPFPRINKNDLNKNNNKVYGSLDSENQLIIEENHQENENFYLANSNLNKKENLEEETSTNGTKKSFDNDVDNVNENYSQEMSENSEKIIDAKNKETEQNEENLNKNSNNNNSDLQQEKQNQNKDNKTSQSNDKDSILVDKNEEVSKEKQNSIENIKNEVENKIEEYNNEEQVKDMLLLEKKNEEDEPKKDGLIKLLLTQEFIWFTLFLSAANLIIVFYLGTVEMQLESIDSQKSKQLTENFTWFLSFGFVMTPIFGVLLDKFRTWFCFIIVEMTFIFFLIFASISNIDIQYITFILISIVKPATYGLLYSYFGKLFPFKHFGKLTGISVFLSAIFSLLQYPLLIMTSTWFHNKYIISNAIQFALIVPFFVLIRLLYIRKI